MVVRVKGRDTESSLHLSMSHGHSGWSLEFYPLAHGRSNTWNFKSVPIVNTSIAKSGLTRYATVPAQGMGAAGWPCGKAEAEESWEPAGGHEPWSRLGLR